MLILTLGSISLTEQFLHISSRPISIQKNYNREVAQRQTQADEADMEAWICESQRII